MRVGILLLISSCTLAPTANPSRVEMVQGEAGAKGDPGAKGDVGATGAPGQPGPAGPTGASVPSGATRTEHYLVDAADFRPYSALDDPGLTHDTSGWYCINDCWFLGLQQLWAPLHLPDGARVTAIKCAGLTVSSFDSIRVDLVFTDTDPASHASCGGGGADGTVDAPTSQIFDVSLQGCVDNGVSLRVSNDFDAPHAFSLHVVLAGGASSGIRRCSVTYEALR